MDAMALLCLASLGILAEGIPAPRSNAWSGAVTRANTKRVASPGARLKSQGKWLWMPAAG